MKISQYARKPIPSCPPNFMGNRLDALLVRDARVRLLVAPVKLHIRSPLELVSQCIQQLLAFLVKVRLLCKCQFAAGDRDEGGLTNPQGPPIYPAIDFSLRVVLLSPFSLFRRCCAGLSGIAVVGGSKVLGIDYRRSEPALRCR